VPAPMRRPTTRWQRIRFAFTSPTTHLRREARVSAAVNHLHLRSFGSGRRSLDLKGLPKGIDNAVRQIPQNDGFILSKNELFSKNELVEDGPQQQGQGKIRFDGRCKFALLNASRYQIRELP